MRTNFCFECGCEINQKHRDWCSLRGSDGWGNALVYLGAMAWMACACAMVWLFASGCASTKPSGKIIVQPDTVYMGAKGWAFSFSPNMPGNPTPNPNGGWFFNFPAKDGVHYLMVPYNAKKPHAILTFTYRVTATSGNPQFVSVQSGCNEPADFRPMLERVGDNMNSEFFRWWSSPPVKLLADGQTHTVSYALQWSNWTGVYGKSNQGEFNTTMNGNLMAVGITFGGGCAAGHGVYVTGGGARFEVLNFRIQ